MPFGEVGDFGAFLSQVVEGPGTASFADDLVVALHHGVGVGVIEKVGMAAVARFATEQGNEGLALMGQDIAAVELAGIAGSREFQEGGQQVNDVTASG